MPKLHEVVTDRTIETLKESARESLLAFEEDTSRKKTAQYAVRYSNDAEIEASYPIVRYVHSRLWALARPAVGLPPGFERRTSGEANIVSIIRELNKDGLLGWKEPQYRSLATQVSRILRANHLLEKVSKGNRLPTWAVAPWRGELNWTQKVEGKPDWRTEQRIAEENAKNSTVVNRYDIRALGAPTATPDGMVEWAEKVVKLFDRLNNQYHATIEDLKSMREERDKLMEAFEKLKTDDWEVAKTRIADLLFANPEDV